jgi:phage shock protein PspC (stress-responsive transcriptional regulator)
MASHINDRRLYRARQDRILFGVCAGLGEYFEVDPVLIRLGFVVITLAGGAGVLAYIILALVLPEQDAASTSGREGLRDDAGQIADDVRSGLSDGPAETGAGESVPTMTARRRRNQEIAALVLIGLGLLLMAGNLGWFAWMNWSIFWPLVLIAIGVAVLLRRER